MTNVAMTNDEMSRENSPKWQILDRNDRRVAGVLIEKAKTTPDNYPLTLNSLLNGANQKSNRFPQMQLDEEHVYDALERLRKLGAVAEVQGDGRVPKFRHLMYDWLGVDKFELAVMAELLLRGAQTLGELRGRAARMEKIPGITELRPVIDSLRSKGLLIYLTPPGRGCVVTHALYQEQELAKLRTEHSNSNVNVDVPENSSAPTPRVAPEIADDSEIDELRAEVAELKEAVSQLREELSQVKTSLGIGSEG